MRSYHGIGVVALAFVLGCGGEAGSDGKAGANAKGAQGARGERGAPGAAGKAGKDGEGAGVNGSRLVARYEYGADGSKFYAGILDTELGAACSFALASDGVRRCIPGDDGIIRFADDACTIPVLFAPQKSCPPHGFARELIDGACDGWTVYAVGAQRPEPTAYSDLFGDCVPTTDPKSTVFDVAIVAPANLVAESID